MFQNFRDRDLTPEEQFDILRRIWSTEERDGLYVFLPYLDGNAKNKEQRRKSWHEGPAYAWPEDADEILAFLRTHEDDDVYFTPGIFNGKNREKDAINSETCLWADLDAVDPRNIEDDLRPTIAWETSPGRFQAIWRFQGQLTGASWAGGLNHRLTDYLGADPSGWDSTQLLRVPGRRNHKPDYREDNDGRPVDGRLLWHRGPYHTIDALDDLLPEMEVAPGMKDLDLTGLEDVDRAAVWKRIRMRVSKNVREFMAVKPGQDVGEADRSNALWQMERDFADAGCTLAESVALIWPTPWNKFRDRQNGFSQIVTECNKAIIEAQSRSQDDVALEGVVGPKPDPEWLTELLTGPRQRPRYLIKGVWSVGAVGFVAAAPKSYKSWTVLDMAISVATGQPFLGHFPVLEPGPVLLIQEEDGQIMTIDRAERVLDGRAPHAHPHGTLHVDGEGQVFWDPPTANVPLSIAIRKGFSASDESWQVWLDEKIENEGHKLVIIDTLGTAAGDVDLDRASDTLSQVLAPLRSIGHKHGCAVVVVHHNRKSADSGRAGSQMLGSVALHAWVEDAIYLRSRESWGDGVSVRAETESKSGPEGRWTLRVPRMGNGAEGDDAARHWAPEVVPWHDDDDDPKGDSGGDAKRASATPLEPEKRPARGTSSRATQAKEEELLDIIAAAGSAGLRSEEVAERMYGADFERKQMTSLRTRLQTLLRTGRLVNAANGYAVPSDDA